MKLRKLQTKDAEGILSWMRDPAINRFFRFTAEAASPQSVESFISRAQNTDSDMHLAIVDENDIYLGTISLKSIDHVASNAEYAISTCSHTHGTGIAFQATREILRIAFEELKLHRVYLNVLVENARANRFYQKCGFVYEGQFRDHVFIHDSLKSINWYSMIESEYNNIK